MLCLIYCIEFSEDKDICLVGVCMQQISSAKHICNVDLLPWKVRYIQMVLLQKQEHSLQLFRCTEQWVFKNRYQWFVISLYLYYISPQYVLVKLFTGIHYHQTLLLYLSILLLSLCQCTRCVCYRLACL